MHGVLAGDKTIGFTLPHSLQSLSLGVACLPLSPAQFSLAITLLPYCCVSAAMCVIEEACYVPEILHMVFLSYYLKAVKLQYYGPSANKRKCQKLHDKTQRTNGPLDITKVKVF